MANSAMLVYGDGHIPLRSHRDDAGWDLTVHLPDIKRMWIDPGESRDVPCGIQVRFPEGWYGRITGRSSTLRHRGLLIVEGVIDEGYTGPLFTYAHNPTEDPQYVDHGDRIGQLLLHPTPPRIEIVRVTDPTALGTTDRGASGFGSTGL